MADTVTVCIPSIPPRHRELGRAVTSVAAQRRPANAISVAIDTEREGAWATRTRAVSTARTDWVALLDDDDHMHPQHLQTLLSHAEADPSVDYWFTWFEVLGGTDPLGNFGKVFDPENPHQTTTTIMVRTRLAQDIGWHLPNPDDVTPERQYAGEDWAFLLDCLRAGAKVEHIPEITWTYVHSGQPGVGNTSGLPHRW